MELIQRTPNKLHLSFVPITSTTNPMSVCASSRRRVLLLNDRHLLPLAWLAGLVDQEELIWLQVQCGRTTLLLTEES